jgi:CBS domain-containing protein
VTDLIALALFGPALALGRSGPDEDARQIPDVATFGAVRAQDLMTPAVWSATPNEPLRVAAERLVQARVHRLVVLARGRTVEGVLSTLDLMRAVRDVRASTPICQYASRSVASVEMGTPVASVMRQLLEGGFTGMPVTDTGWPVGFISQAELLAARHRPTTTPVEEIASPSFLCLPEPTAIGKAAEEGLRQGIRRLLLVRSRQVTGILTSVDFARAVAQGC